MEKLLYVEDEELTGTLTSHFLQHNKVETEWMKDGEEAIKAMRERTFGLILSDYQIPNSEVWRKYLNECDTPLIYLTGMSEEEIEKPKCFIKYIQKPTDLEKLVNTIKAKLSKI